jgi:uncharacterized membrane protein YcaP (DUF421 family)
MKEYEITITDIQRILFGQVTGYFYIEAIFRILIIYLILVMSMRLMGKRLSSQMSRNEMAAISSLAAAIGIPLMNPDRGILPAVIIAIIIIIFQVLVARKAAANRRFEALTQDRLEVVAEDGKLNPKVMLHTRVSRDRVFAQLRSANITHLGMVNRLYFEASGNFTVVQASEPKPGLSILPEWDKELISDLLSPVATQICYHCGEENSKESGDGKKICAHCGYDNWVAAVEEKKE